MSLEAELAAIVGTANVITEAEALRPAVSDWRGRYSGRARCLVRPAATAEVARVVAACARHGAAMVPQGGNTGVCGGAIPDAGGREVIVSLARMNRIRGLDAANNTIAVEAGCILAEVNRAAEAAGRLFPMDLGSEGSCQIGGTISTNAGGTRVLRWGNMRELVLGLEVVLADGRVLDAMRGLRKDNAGYDLKQMFIGAEGTLGIVTGAVLKLVPRPAASATAFVALESCEAALGLIDHLRGALGDRLSAFELISAPQLEAVLAQIPGTRRPLATTAPWWVLLEAADSGAQQVLDDALEQGLMQALDAGLARDASVARSGREAQEFWRLRHSVSEANVKTGRVISHDTSVPVSRVPEFIARCSGLAGRFDGLRLHVVGHLGDGNVHMVAIFPPGQPGLDALAREVSREVHEIAAGLGGSIAAEHGVGQSLRDQLAICRSPVELDLMRGLKRLLDPQGLMNPGKVVPAG
jgi:FAD/FMN-containing dehydrogenase